jgi:cell division septation protein DedD
MAASRDTEITLGTAKLLGVFFGLVAICAVFFALGYTLGRKADPNATGTSATPLLAGPSGSKPAVAPSAAPMSFYKSVEQKDANAQLTPASSEAGNGNATSTAIDQPPNAAPVAKDTPTTNPADPNTAMAANGYFVQVAAVSKEDDAEALVDALKQKQYPAFVANGAPADKLFRVQIGPYADIKDAEQMRSRLTNDGYNPILKK